MLFFLFVVCFHPFETIEPFEQNKPFKPAKLHKPINKKTAPKLGAVY
jgi:hypothetical protein